MTEPLAAPQWLIDLVIAPQAEDTQPDGKDDQTSAFGERMRAYATATIDGVLREAAEAKRGTRNDVLNRAAFKLGQFAIIGMITEALAIDCLKDSANDCGLTEDDGPVAVEKTILSGLRAGMTHPAELPPDREQPKTEQAKQQGKEQKSEQKAAVPILSSGDFVRGFMPPAYVIDGILQRGFLYSLTGQTGSGKTAIALRIMASVALGRSLGTRNVQQGRCAMCVGENADDVRMRWIALSEQMGFDADTIPVDFIPGVFPIAAMGAVLKREETGELTLVIVDTSAAYFPGEEENSNKELGDYARTLRTLTSLPGKPCVIVNCHPTKNAAGDNLIPRGGGAFVAEMDGNLCCSKNDTVSELHWQGKFRGPDFEPIAFDLVSVTSPQLVNSRGGTMPTVIARPISDDEQANRADMTTRNMETLLALISENEGASVSDLAKAAGWVSGNGAPHKSKVHRLISDLRKKKLIAQSLNGWVLTTAGDKAAKKAQK